MITEIYCGVVIYIAILLDPIRYKLELFEACACGSRLMSNISPATKSIAVDDSVVWIDLDSNPSELADKMFSALNSESRISSKLNEGFSLEESLLKWQNLLRSVMTT